MNLSKRQTIIRELRHQLYYTNPGPEREEVRRQLDYWLVYNRKG
ncbi:hypothetical protein [Kovacikia minuta]|nr:hypothetical protein [Kovacikia minuta]